MSGPTAMIATVLNICPIMRLDDGEVATVSIAAKEDDEIENGDEEVAVGVDEGVAEETVEE